MDLFLDFVAAALKGQFLDETWGAPGGSFWMNSGAPPGRFLDECQGAPGGQPACRVSLAFAMPWLLAAKRVVTMLGAPRISLSRWHVDEMLF